MSSEIIVPRQFRGPPVTVNGGYICALIANAIGGRGTTMLRAGVPVEAPFKITVGDDGVATATSTEGSVLATAKPLTDADLPTPPPGISIADAERAAATSPFAERSLHRGCFSCCIEREAGEGLGVYVGQVQGQEPGFCAGVWTPHANFATADGTVPDVITWGALDCPGSMAWFIKNDSPVGLLGTMSGEVIRRPKAGEKHVVLAWTENVEGRRHYAGVALYTASGELLARGRQIWIGRPPQQQTAAS